MDITSASQGCVCPQQQYFTETKSRRWCLSYILHLTNTCALQGSISQAMGMLLAVLMVTPSQQDIHNVENCYVCNTISGW